MMSARSDFQQQQAANVRRIFEASPFWQLTGVEIVETLQDRGLLAPPNPDNTCKKCGVALRGTVHKKICADCHKVIMRGHQRENKRRKAAALRQRKAAAQQEATA